MSDAVFWLNLGVVALATGIIGLIDTFISRWMHRKAQEELKDEC